jgi:DNA-directed RNA polymerase subunit M/transcription elongation factor TFIIS
MSESVKTVKQVCKCENCGNEAEMVLTCTLEEVEAAPEAAAKTAQETPKRAKGKGVCSHCGNEAEMWVDL